MFKNSIFTPNYRILTDSCEERKHLRLQWDRLKSMASAAAFTVQIDALTGCIRVIF